MNLKKNNNMTYLEFYTKTLAFYLTKDVRAFAIIKGIFNLNKMELKNGMKVIAPEGCRDYLTEGKEYEVRNITFGDFGTFFNITDNDGERLDCMLKDDGHLNYANWIIKQEEKPISLNLDLLIEVAEAVNNDYFKIRLTHLKNDLQQLAKDTPNDSELGAKFRKLINQ
jgi:hypothetical protein